MKKIFTFAAAMLVAISTFAAPKVIALPTPTVDGSSTIYTYSSADEIKVKNVDAVWFEIPTSVQSGEFYVKGSGSNDSRWLYIHKDHGETRDTSRKIVFQSSYGDPFVFTANDIKTDDGKSYLVFSTGDDYKMKNECAKLTIVQADPTKATVKSISLDGVVMANFDADTLVYNIELDYGTTSLPVVTAVAGDDASIVVNQAAALPGTATVVCTSQDESTTVTYTLNFSVAASPSDDATLKSLSIGGKALAGFDASLVDYNYELEYDATEAPTVSAEKNESHANLVINQAAAIPGIATVVVTAQDGVTSKTYTIHFTLETNIPIIRAIHTGASTASVKGSIGGTATKNTQGDGKLGSNGHYFGVALAGEGEFLAGDSLVIVASVLYGGNSASLFTEKEGTNAIATVPFDAESKICSYVLLADAPALYVVRKDGAVCNPAIASISVYRPVDDGQPKLNVNPDSIALAVTAAIPADSAVVTFSGKNLAAGEYALTVPDLAGLTVNPASVTVGDDGKLNAAIKIKYATEATVDAASTAISLTIGELTKTVKVGYSAIQAKQYISSINIEQLVLDNGKSYNINAALTAAHIDFANINSLDSLNDDKTKRNEPYLGLKIKAADAYVAGWLKANDTLSVKFGNVGDAIKVRINGQEQTIAKVDINSSVFGHRATDDEYVEIITTSTSTVVLKQIMVNEPIADVILPAATKFEATCLILDHGTIKVGDNKSSAIYAPNDIVKITLTPNEGYYLVEWNVYKEGDASTKVTVSNDSTFIMPEYNVNVSAVLAQAEPVLYTVTIGELTNGTIEFANLGNEDHKFYQGDTVRLIITPADGYELVSANAGNEALIPDEDGNCAFEMPAQDVTVTATFKAVTPEPVLYTVTLGTYEHGTVAFIEPNADHQYAEGEEVRLSVTPDEGYELETISLEGINLAIPVVDGVATFSMPAQDVVVLATFKAAGEGFEYIDASTKAVKFFDNGKLLIKRGDKVFDAKGQIVE